MNLEKTMQILQHQAQRHGDNKNAGRSKIISAFKKVLDKLRGIGRTNGMIDDMLEDALVGKNVFCLTWSRAMARDLLDQINHPFIQLKKPKKLKILLENYNHDPSTDEGKIIILPFKGLSRNDIRGRVIEELYVDHSVTEMFFRERLHVLTDLIKQWEEYSLDQFDFDIELNVIYENSEDKCPQNK